MPATPAPRSDRPTTTPCRRAPDCNLSYLLRCRCLWCRAECTRFVVVDIDLGDVALSPAELAHRREAAVAADHPAGASLHDQRLDLLETQQAVADGRHVALVVGAGVAGIGVQVEGNSPVDDRRGGVDPRRSDARGNATAAGVPAEATGFRPSEQKSDGAIWCRRRPCPALFSTPDKKTRRRRLSRPDVAHTQLFRSLSRRVA